MIQPRVLRGVRIVEQGTFITGPCAGMMLADLGADVIKIESPDGDPVPQLPGRPVLAALPGLQPQQAQHRAATSSVPADRAVFDRLIRAPTCTSRTSAPAPRSGSAPAGARLQELNPRLVYCSISGFGGERPVRRAPELRLGGAGAVRIPERRRRPGAAALSWARRWPMRSPASTRPTASWPRWSSAAATAGAAWSKCPCWRRWRISPSSRSPPSSRSATVPRSSDRPRLAQAYILRTADGGLIAIHLSSLEKFWQGLTTALEAGELDARPAFQRAPRAHRQLRSARRGARPLLPPAPARATGRQRLSRKRRAVRADQRHRCGGRGSAGAAPRPDRARGCGEAKADAMPCARPFSSTACARLP